LNLDEVVKNSKASGSLAELVTGTEAFDFFLAFLILG
jgi:hypothetical protein